MVPPDELDRVVVVTADPFRQRRDDESWRHKRANHDPDGSLTDSLPEG